MRLVSLVSLASFVVAACSGDSKAPSTSLAPVGAPAIAPSAPMASVSAPAMSDTSPRVGLSGGASGVNGTGMSNGGTSGMNDSSSKAGASAPSPISMPPGSDKPMAVDDSAAPPWPPSGLPNVDFKMDVAVAAGVELHDCHYAALPTNRGVIAVSGAESHYTPGSHHLIAYRTDLTSIPDDTPDIFDCYSFAGGFHEGGSYYEAQQPDSHRELPNGVAHKFQPGEVILLESHYINTGTVDLVAHVEFSMHTVDLALVKAEAGTIMWSNFQINIPPHTKTRVTMTCPIMQDMNPALLWSHMHSRGMNFVATTDDAAAAAALGTLYAEPDWSEPQPRVYPSNPPVTLHAGTNVTFSCDYQNDTDMTFSYGQSAQTDEMCILHGMYWPRTTMFGAEGCLSGTSTSTQL